MPEVTVVMPSLNVKNYIGRCIESVLKQTLSDIEILVIDAGSTDGTEEIIQKYKENDSRVKVVTSERKSYGYQINMGIDMAQGKYLAIVETDDYIEETMLSDLYYKAEEYGLDFIKSDNYNFIQKGNSDIWKERFYSVSSKLYDIVINPDEHREIHLSDIFIWKGLYNINFLKENNIRLNESNGAAFQDAGFLFQTIGFAKKVMYLNKVHYYYRQDNLYSSIYNKNGFSYLANEYEFIYNRMQQEEIWKSIEPYFYCRLFMQINGRIRTMAASGEIWKETMPEIVNLYQKIKAANKEHIFDEYILDMNTWTDMQMFIYDYEKYIHMQMNLYAMKREMLHEMYSSLSDYDTIVFYSCSNIGKYIDCLLEKCGVNKNIVFCDNNSNKWDTIYAGKKVYSCEKAVSMFKNAVYIIANRNYSKNMREQLLGLGVKSKDIIQYRLGCDLLLLHF